MTWVLVKIFTPTVGHKVPKGLDDVLAPLSWPGENPGSPLHGYLYPSFFKKAQGLFNSKTAQGRQDKTAILAEWLHKFQRILLHVSKVAPALTGDGELYTKSIPFSSKATEAPLAPAAPAAIIPAGPPPITITSNTLDPMDLSSPFNSLGTNDTT